MNARLKPQTCTRPMEKADVDAVMRIELANYPYPWTHGNFSDSLNSGHSCWVLTNDDMVIGYTVIMLVLDEVHLLNICVDAGFQGLGLGRELLAHAMQVGREHGGTVMFLEVRPSNHSALKLYEDMGFNEMGMRRNYYPTKGGREDAVLMGCAL